MIRTIFFDIGDTLVYDDPPMIDRVRMALDACGTVYDPDRVTPAFRAAEDFALTRYLAGVPFDNPELMAECSRIIIDRVGCDVSPLLGETYAGITYIRRVHPDATRLLATLVERGFTLGVISDWECTLPSLLAEMGILRHFTGVAVSETVGVTKPHPRLFREGLALASASPDESMHVGDYYELDVEGARVVGITPILFDWKARYPAADCVRVETFDALNEFLLALPPPNSLGNGSSTKHALPTASL